MKTKLQLFAVLSTVLVLAGCCGTCNKVVHSEYVPGYYEDGYYVDASCQPAYHDAYGNYHPQACVAPFYVEGRWHRPMLVEFREWTEN